MTDPDRAFREGLAELAREADATAPAPLVARARAEAARRRRRGTALAATGAAAAVLGIGGVAAVRGGPLAGHDAAGPARTPAASPARPVPGGYRAEYWHGVSVLVPVTWGWGAAPVPGRAGTSRLCGGGQVVQADGSRRERLDQPYVGRPVVLSDACDAGWADARPRAPYVWLGGDVPVGTVDLGGGWVRRTVAVGGVTVTVASDDPALRRRILDSARPAAGACRPRLGEPPAPGGTTAAGFVPVAMTVCAYASTTTRRDYDLVYEQQLTMGPAKDLAAAVAGAEPAGEHACFGASGGEWALLHLVGEGGAWRDYVVDLSCPSIADPAGTQHVLDERTVVPWAVGGVNAVLHASPLVDAPGRLVPSGD